MCIRDRDSAVDSQAYMHVHQDREGVWTTMCQGAWVALLKDLNDFALGYPATNPRDATCEKQVVDVRPFVSGPFCHFFLTDSHMQLIPDNQIKAWSCTISYDACVSAQFKFRFGKDFNVSLLYAWGISICV